MIEIATPQTREEFEAYFDVRWRVLRAAWDKPRGSERDELDALVPGDPRETQVVHVMARQVDEGAGRIGGAGVIVGAGRGQVIAAGEAQIRYMAVLDEARNQGAGARMLAEIESRLRELGVREAMLNARERAVNFYKRHGYTVAGPAPALYGVIVHFKMTKRL